MPTSSSGGRVKISNSDPRPRLDLGLENPTALEAVAGEPPAAIWWLGQNKRLPLAFSLRILPEREYRVTPEGEERVYGSW
jgi:hypothetical protein